MWTGPSQDPSSRLALDPSFHQAPQTQRPQGRAGRTYSLAASFVPHSFLMAFHHLAPRGRSWSGWCCSER